MQGWRGAEKDDELVKEIGRLGLSLMRLHAFAEFNRNGAKVGQRGYGGLCDNCIISWNGADAGGIGPIYVYALPQIAV